MADVIKALYEVSFGIFNTLIDVAMTLFQTSAKTAAGGSSYANVKVIFEAISDATIPLTCVFFLVALYKTVITSPPEQCAQRFLMDAIRYCLILFVADNLWDIMGEVMNIADGITDKIGVSGNYHMSYGAYLKTIIEETLVMPEFALSGEYVASLLETCGCFLMFLLSGVVLMFIMVASCLSIISSAFGRILKPLIMLPFSGIAVAMGAGGHEVSRSMYHYLKMFIGFCLSGAMMIICIKVGFSLTTNLVSFELSSASDLQKVLYMTVQASITPIVIAGLVKTCDSLSQHMF